MMSFLHPSEADLERFAAGDIAKDQRERMAGHLPACGECRATIAFLRDVQQRARALDVPAASAELINRVLAERAQGERYILPSLDNASRTGMKLRVRLTIAAGVAAAILLIVFSNRARVLENGTLPVPGSERAEDEPASSLAELFTPGIAFALESPPPGPRVPRIANLDGTRLTPRAIRIEYRLVEASGKATVTATSDLRLSATTLDGRAAWMFTSISIGHSTTEAETAYVTRADLRPLGRLTHVRPYASYREIVVRHRYFNDSIIGWMNTDRTIGRRVARKVPREFGPFLATEGIAPFFFGALTVHEGWEGSLSLLGWAVVARDLFFPVTLRVEGNERVTVPAGTFDCWRLRVMAGSNTTIDFWIRKTDGVAVKTHHRTPTREGRTRESVLLEG